MPQVMGENRRAAGIITLVAVAVAGLLTCAAVSVAAQAESTAKPEPNDPNLSTATSTVTVDTTAITAKLTVEELQASKKQAAESQDLADDVKAKVSEVYDKAIAQLKLAEDLAAKLKQYKDNRANAPTALTDVRALLDKPVEQPTLDDQADMVLAQAEQGLTKATLQLDEAKKKVADLESEPKKRADRRTKIPEETRTAQQQVEEIKKKLAETAEVQDQSALDRANRTLLQTQRLAAENRAAANAEELLFYDATNELLAAQRDLALRQLTASEKLVTLWQNKVAALQQKAADAAKQQAIRDTEETRYSHPAIQQLAQENLTLAELQQQLLTKVQQAKDKSMSVDGRVAGLKATFEEITRQVKTAGKVTDAMGMILLGQRDKLPKINEARRNIRTRPGEIATAQLSAMEYDKKWSDLSDLTDEIKAVEDELEPSISQAARQAVTTEAVSYYETRRKTLRAISDLYWDYATRLAALDAAERSLVELTTGFRSFIDSNVLWVRSSQTVGQADAEQTARAMLWLASPANWKRLGRAVWADCKAQPSYYCLVALLAPVLVMLRARLRARMASMAELVRQVETDRFFYSILTLGFSAMIAAMLPIFLLFAYYRLAAVAPADFGQAIALGLLRVAVLVFVLSFLKYIIMPGGLAHEHLRVRQESLTFVRRHMRWLCFLLVPAVFLFELMRAQQYEQAWYGTVGRLFFIASLAVLAVFLLIVLRPTRPLMEFFLKQRRGTAIDRTRYLWYPLCLILPLSFAVLAGMGYLYGAYHLSQRLVSTGALILSIVLTRAMFVRGLTIAQRKLARLERLNRQSALEQSAADSASATAGDESAALKVKPEQSIFEISRQTRRIIGATLTVLFLGGVWYIWSDVMPAIAGLGHHKLYESAGDVVTLGSVVAAFVAIIVTMIVARNAPGLLEIMILRHLPLDRGIRFAIITICRYVLVIVGTVLAFSEMGLSWSKLQWLVAAMGVGLGFGLQEIFANFISGLIILFEQPVRVNDIVTVGEVTGEVSMIRIRATTIRQWDQRELIVPNKEFITGRLVNWTLSDNTLRVDFCVGIAYGSDIRKAERLLYEIAAADERVLQDPPPVVLFEAFGESSLDFELRVYISGIGHRLPVQHDINTAIDDRFKKAGIEIAFPQWDVHIRSASSAHTPGLPQSE